MYAYEKVLKKKKKKGKMLHLWGKIIKKKIQLVFAVNGFMYR